MRIWILLPCLLLALLLSSCILLGDLYKPSPPVDRQAQREALKVFEVPTIYAMETDLLRELNRCLDAFQQIRGQFPVDLKAIGPEGTQCASAAVEARAQYRHTSISYSPRSAGGHDAVSAYTIEVRSLSNSNLRLRTDETGSLFLYADGQFAPFAPPFARLDDPQEKVPPPDGRFLRHLLRLEWELECYRGCRTPASYPDSTSKLPEACEPYAAGELEAGLRAGRLDGYRYRYLPGVHDQNGTISSYRIEARPAAYGRPWKTSFLVDATQNVWSTTEDRAAETSDPILLAPRARAPGAPTCPSEEARNVIALQRRE